MAQEETPTGVSHQRFLEPQFIQVNMTEPITPEDNKANGVGLLQLYIPQFPLNQDLIKATEDGLFSAEERKRMRTKGLDDKTLPGSLRKKANQKLRRKRCIYIELWRSM